MFRTVMIALLLCAPSAGLANPDRIPVVYQTLDGKPYAKVRGFLLIHGNVPLDLRASAESCAYYGGTCRYPELLSCFADAPACVFIWRTKDGHFLHVQTDRVHSEAADPVGVITKETDY